MANLTSRLVISLVDRVSGPARALTGSLNKLHNVTNRHFVAMNRHARGGTDAMRGFATSAAAAGVGMYGFVNATKEFNKAEWGYTFAKIPDFYKGLRLDLEGLQRDTKATTDQSRKVARELGLIPRDVQRARTEVEKVGKSGALGESLFGAALGLNMSDDAMPSDTGVKFLNAMFNSYEKQRAALAQRMGVDQSDPKQRDWFDRQWLRGTAAKSAFAASESALDPDDLVEGARQYAPQWASLGMTPEEVLGAIAHGSNYGFGASELGTSLKSWGNRLVKPTAAGQSWMNSLGMNRDAWTDGVGAADPMKATTAINRLLGSQVYSGRRGQRIRRAVRAMLDEGARDGTTATPEFQGKLTRLVQEGLGRGWDGKHEDVAEAVRNATLTATGGINIMGFIREGLAKGMTRPAMLEILEGKHVARNTPLFEYFDALVTMVEGLQNIDAMHLDGVEQARRESRDGKLAALAGSWEELLLTFQDTGVSDRIVSGLKTVIQFISSLDPELVKMGTTFALLTVLAAPVVFAFRAIASVLGVIRAGASIAARVAGIGGAAGGAGAGIAGGAAAGAGVKSLFSLKNQRANAAADKAARDKLRGSYKPGGPNYRGVIAEGMSKAGAAAAPAAPAAKAAGKGLAKGALRFIPGIGLVIAGGMAAYDSYQGYQKDGWKGAILNPLTLGMYSGGASAAPLGPGPTIAAAGNQTASGAVKTVVDDVRGIVAGVDLTAEGARIIQTLAAGMRSAIPAVQSAASSAAAAAASSALRGAYSDGAR